MLTYLRVEIRRMLRNVRYLVFSLVMPVLLYVVFSKSAGGGAGLVRGIPFAVYFMVSMAAYAGSLAATFTGGPRLDGPAAGHPAADLGLPGHQGGHGDAARPALDRPGRPGRRPHQPAPPERGPLAWAAARALAGRD